MEVFSSHVLECKTCEQLAAMPYAVTYLLVKRCPVRRNCCVFSDFWVVFCNANYFFGSNANHCACCSSQILVFRIECWREQWIGEVVPFIYSTADVSNEAKKHTNFSALPEMWSKIPNFTLLNHSDEQSVGVYNWTKNKSEHNIVSALHVYILEYY